MGLRRAIAGVISPVGDGNGPFCSDGWRILPATPTSAVLQAASIPPQQTVSTSSGRWSVNEALSYGKSVNSYVAGGYARFCSVGLDAKKKFWNVACVGCNAGFIMLACKYLGSAFYAHWPVVLPVLFLPI